MLSCPKPCKVCSKATEPGSVFCKEHAANHAAFAEEHKRQHDEVDLEYGRIRWLRCRQVMLAQNPICQRIVKGGAQCTHAAVLVHHIWSPKVRPDLFIEPSNLVALCSTCHDNSEGTPWWTAGKDYVPTEFKLMVV